jgi:hypothetical protein
MEKRREKVEERRKKKKGRLYFYKREKEKKKKCICYEISDFGVLIELFYRQIIKYKYF